MWFHGDHMGSFQLKAPRLSALTPTEHEYQNPKNSWFVDDFRNFQSQTWLWLKLLWFFSYYQGYHYVRLCPHPLWVLKHIKTFVRNLRTFTKKAPHQPSFCGSTRFLTSSHLHPIWMWSMHEAAVQELPQTWKLMPICGGQIYTSNKWEA